MKKYNNYLGRNFKRKLKADTLSKDERSVLMSKIRSRNTKFEKDFIKILRKKSKSKIKTNVRSILGNPDIVIYNERICVFLDSDFWHGWYYPRWKHLLKNDFWRSKIERNRKRDVKVKQYLIRHKWKVIRIWEHQIKKDPEKCVNVIIQSLYNHKPTPRL